MGSHCPKKGGCIDQYRGKKYLRLPRALNEVPVRVQFCRSSILVRLSPSMPLLIFNPQSLDPILVFTFFVNRPTVLLLRSRSKIR